MKEPRQFRFRAWDDKKKEWLLGYEMPNLGGFDMFGECMLFGEWTQILNSRPLQELDAIKLMQSTNLFDRNGKEIWEGDLVKADLNHIGQADCIREVIWKFSGFYIEVTSGDYVTLHRQTPTLEIIGDIYSTPNLLNQ